MKQAVVATLYGIKLYFQKWEGTVEDAKTRLNTSDAIGRNRNSCLKTAVDNGTMFVCTYKQFRVARSL